MTKVNRPEYVEEDMLTFLDNLQENGCSLYGAADELVYDWPRLTKRQRNNILGYHIKTYWKRHGEKN